MPEDIKADKPDVVKEETFSADGIEIFEVGTYRGQKWTEGDLDSIVSAHAEIGAELKPILKLGHNDKQPLLKGDGLPSAGNITNLRRVGTKLIADFRDIPRVIKDLISKRAYKRVSSEIYQNFKHQSGRVYKRALRAVALLGSDMPEVKTLQDVTNLYTVECGVGELITIFSNEKENLTMDAEKILSQKDEQIEELKAKVLKFEEEEVTLKQDVTDAETKVGEAETKATEATEAKDELEKEKKEVEEKVEKQTRTDLIDAAIKAGKIMPAEKEHYITLAEKDFETTKKLVETMGVTIDFGEKTKKEEKPNPADNTEDDITMRESFQEKVSKYMEDHPDSNIGDVITELASKEEVK